jgi:hypothetical protein
MKCPWYRLSDGSPAWAAYGRAGASNVGEKLVVTLDEMEFITQDGRRITVDNLKAPRRSWAPIGSPRVGEWWRFLDCGKHGLSLHDGVFQWEEGAARADCAERVRCGCLRPEFAPGVMDGPHGVQG